MTRTISKDTYTASQRATCELRTLEGDRGSIRIDGSERAKRQEWALSGKPLSGKRGQEPTEFISMRGTIAADIGFDLASLPLPTGRSTVSVEEDIEDTAEDGGLRKTRLRTTVELEAAAMP